MVDLGRVDLGRGGVGSAWRTRCLYRYTGTSSNLIHEASPRYGKHLFRGDIVDAIPISELIMRHEALLW